MDRKQKPAAMIDRRRTDRTFSLYPGDWHYACLAGLLARRRSSSAAFPCASTVAQEPAEFAEAQQRGCAGPVHQSASPASRAHPLHEKGAGHQTLQHTTEPLAMHECFFMGMRFE